MKNNTIEFSAAKFNLLSKQKKSLFKKGEKIKEILASDKVLFMQLETLLMEDYVSNDEIDFFNEGFKAANLYINKPLNHIENIKSSLSELFAMYYAHMNKKGIQKDMENSGIFINAQQSYFGLCYNLKQKEKIQQRITQIQLLYNQIQSILNGQNELLDEYIRLHRNIYKIDSERRFFEGYQFCFFKIVHSKISKLS
jgi:hypothetical protein